MLWNFVIGPAGAVLFGAALVLLAASTVLRERTVSRAGTTDRLATSRPVLHGLVFTFLVLGIGATAVRMGVMT
ncbi:hypothetical protein [Nocardia flavorosea]|uniref:Uncharacterized protein n=1 Tax=Nocardia flavorosea TaxID=53429 RepID=A0A846YD83_9NOCA|nr:hypothetical protein [Nocardia flavorosea]NKY57003.1 hypothetical protein [Nocardia flavorosea]